MFYKGIDELKKVHITHSHDNFIIFHENFKNNIDMYFFYS